MKWDGFRALVSTEEGLRVRSRRGWDMTQAVPELEALPRDFVLDGELVAWADGQPYFPDVCHRILNRDLSIALTFTAFDVLRIAGDDLMYAPYSQRRGALEELDLNGPGCATSETFEDGASLFTAVCEPASKASWRSGSQAGTGRTVADGSSAGTRTTGASIWSARPWLARGSVGSEVGEGAGRKEQPGYVRGQTAIAPSLPR